jgi:hypothetical protein
MGIGIEVDDAGFGFRHLSPAPKHYVPDWVALLQIQFGLFILFSPAFSGITSFSGIPAFKKLNEEKI